jgi:hypothetical protein
MRVRATTARSPPKRARPVPSSWCRTREGTGRPCASWLESRTRPPAALGSWSSPLARLAASSAARRRERSVRGPCFSAEGGRGACRIRVNADCPFWRNRAVRLGRAQTPEFACQQRPRATLESRSRRMTKPASVVGRACRCGRRGGQRNVGAEHGCPSPADAVGSVKPRTDRRCSLVSANEEGDDGFP